jgi:hypothetical protein
MPEAPVDEYCNLRLLKDEIWLSEDPRLPAPSLNPDFPKEPRCTNLGGYVIATMNARHDN